MLVEIILIGTICGGLGGGEGKIPIKDDSLNKTSLFVLYLMEESSIWGEFESILGHKLEVKKSNWLTVMIFPSWGNHIVQNIVNGTTFIAYVQFQVKGCT